MLNDLVTNQNYLNTLFTEKDFNFINSFNSEIKEINSKISYQEKLRDDIVQFINSIADVLKLNDHEIDNKQYRKSFDTVNGVVSLHVKSSPFPMRSPSEKRAPQIS